MLVEQNEEILRRSGTGHRRCVASKVRSHSFGNDLPQQERESAPSATAATWPPAKRLTSARRSASQPPSPSVEPGTQLTMRTFHTGGVAGGDITQGLPRVEELFEARKPKGLAEICEADGTVVSIEAKKGQQDSWLRVRGEEERQNLYRALRCQTQCERRRLCACAGGQITRGPLDPQDILRLNGVEGVYQYLLKEVQRVYKQQGVDINDKHVEVIVSQMLSKYKIERCR